MGGGGFLGLGPAPSAPAAPDYTGAAQATAAGNLEAARANIAANRVNQYTPYGSLTYQMAGEDKYGNPMWSATQTLSPEQQQLLDIQNRTSLGLGNLESKGLDYVSNMLSQPFDTSKLVSTGFNPSQSYQDAYMQRLQPQISQSRELLNNQLANQGIPVGSEAWNRAQMLQGQKENDLLAAATTQGFNVGQAARQQGFNELAYQRNEPINTLNAVRSGAQVTSPTYVNPANQASTQGPDLLSAAMGNYQNQLANYNAQQAAQGGLNQGLLGLGGSLGAAGIMKYSDVRLKKNIKSVGWLPNGLPVYTYEYIDEIADHPSAGRGEQIGVMAQDVEKLYPHAVITLNDGHKMVNYGLLP